MKNIRDTCISFLHDEDLRKVIREMIKPLIQIMYNEIYIYLWLLCFYSLFLFFIVLAILVILVRLIHTPSRILYGSGQVNY
jgi:hypothetical protein